MEITLPMEAKQVAALPDGDGWQFEPKWDGFRCLAFVEQGEVELRSKSGKPLARYFPEVVAALERLPDVVLDGELIIPVGPTLSFEALQLRLHPAASRIRRLASETPARFMLFDHLVDAAAPLSTRRRALEAFYDEHRGGVLRLSPATTDRAVAGTWLARLGDARDGVVAKRSDAPYRSGERAMLKIKNLRTADCVVGGYRIGSRGDEVASMLLGLYDADGRLHHVGFTSGLAALDKCELTARLHALRTEQSFTVNAPGGPSRWNRGKETAWHPVEPVLVAEVQYDHVTADRFRHGTAFHRWRPDKAPRICRFDQLAVEARPAVLAAALQP